MTKRHNRHVVRIETGDNVTSRLIAAAVLVFALTHAFEAFLG